MSMNNDILKKCIVRLKYESTIDTEKFEGSGSGAIVHLDKNKQKRDYFYIFTAKHTFFKDNTNNEDMDESKINSNNISIFDFKNKKTDSKVVSIIGINKKYDFVILVVKKATYPLPEIPSLPIYEDDFKDCKICGFPSSKKPDKNTSILFDCTYSMRDDVHDTYEVKSNILLTIDGENLNANKEISGLSGSGVFVESATGKPYLAGIQIQTASHNSLVCLDIRTLAREINEALKNHVNKYEPVHVDGYVIKDELGLNTDDLEAFGDMLNTLKDKKFDEEYGLRTKSYKELIDVFNGKIKQELDIESKELANKYLYLSLLFHREKDNRRSTVYFKKAVKNNPSYYALFLKAKDERKLTDKEKEKYHEISSEVSNSDISADDLFFEMLDNKLKKSEDFYEKEGLYMQIIRLLEARFLDLTKEGKDTTEIKKEIASKCIEFFNQYIEEKKFDDADSVLDKLKKYDYDITYKEYELYTDKFFLSHISFSKLDLSKKYLELLEKHKDDSEKFSKLKSQLEGVYSDETDVVQNEIKTVKQKMVNYEEKVEELVQIFNTYIDDKEVLYKVDEVKNQLNTSHIKLDNISNTIKSNHDFLIQMLLHEVIETNKELVVGVQKIYKDSKTNEKLVQTLNSTIKYMKQRIKILPTQGDKQPDMRGIEGVITESNSTLYKDIKKLYEDNTDSIKDDLFRKSLILAEKRHQEHLVSLKKSLKEKREEVEFLNKEISNLKESIVSLKDKNMSLDEKIKELRQIESDCKNLKNKIEIDKDNLSLEVQKELESTTTELEKEISELKSQLTLKEKDIKLIKSQFREEIAMLNSWILALESEYKESKQQSQEVSEKFSKLSDEKAKLEGELEKFSNFDETKKNDIKLLIDKHKREINELKNLIEQWKGKTEQLNNLKTSIDLSSKTATSLVNLEKKYEEKIKIIEARFKKIKHNPKNEKRLKKIFKEILLFENKLDDIKSRVDIYPIKKDSQITLHLLESDLEKIDHIIKKRYSLIYSVYSKIRFFIISVIAFVFIVIFFGLGKGI